MWRKSQIHKSKNIVTSKKKKKEKETTNTNKHLKMSFLTYQIFKDENKNPGTPKFSYG